jgi:hypothetical protein
MSHWRGLRAGTSQSHLAQIVSAACCMSVDNTAGGLAGEEIQDAVLCCCICLSSAAAHAFLVTGQCAKVFGRPAVERVPTCGHKQCLACMGADSRPDS